MSKPGMGNNLPRVRRDWGGSNRDVATSSPGCARSSSPSPSVIGPWYWGFHTVWGGVDPGELDFRPRVVGGVEISKDVCTRDGVQSSLGAARLGGGGGVAPRGNSRRARLAP